MCSSIPDAWWAAITTAVQKVVAQGVVPVDEVVAAQAKVVDDYRGGNANALNALVGSVMKATKGQANPQAVNEILAKKLAGE